jgi:hypothetical protein
MLRFMPPTICQGDRSGGAPGRNADGKGDKDSEGGNHQHQNRVLAPFGEKVARQPKRLSETPA